MKALLYIGNKLSRHGSTATAIETLGPLLEADGFLVRYASSKQNKLLRFIDMLWATIAGRTRTDYVLIDTYSTQNFWYAVAIAWICKRLKLKYIPILHGGNLPSRLESNPKLCKMVFGSAYKNVAPSGYLADAFRDAGYDVAYIPNPVDINAFQFFRRTEIGPRLLWVRSFAAIYNPEMAVEAFSLIKSRFPDASLCMVGPDKGMMDSIRQSARDKNLDITFTGRQTRQEWAALSRNFDIFINTAHIDNAPFSIIEAAALGMVIISTNVGGIPYLLKHRESALLVNDNDSPAMADAVLEVVENDRLARDLLCNSRKLASDSDWNSVREKWLEILV